MSNSADALQRGDNRLNRHQISALLFAILFYALDIMDWQLLAMVGAAAIKDTGLSRDQFGILLGAPLIGVGLSGFFAGMLADRIGRVKVIIGCVVWYSIFTLAFPLAQNFPQMLILRILAGVGLGAQWGIGNTLVAEWLPPQWRAKASAGIQAGFCIGAVAAAYWAQLIVPLHGWRSVFWIGALGLLVAVVALFFLREPPVRLQAIAAGEGKAPPHRFRMLFSREYQRTTICVFLMLLGATLAYWASFSWIPTWLTTERGLQFIRSMDYMVLLNIGGLLSFIVIGMIGDRYGRKRPAFVGFVLAAAALLVFVNLPDDQALKWFAPFYGFLSSPIFGLFGVYLAELYPAQIRATAVTGLYNTARLVAFVGPSILGWLSTKFSMTFAIGSTAILYILCLIPLMLLPETFKKSPQQTGA